MGQFKKIQLSQFNRYSWAILLAFMCATFAMQSHTSNISFKDIFQALPLIVIVVYWSQQSNYSLKKDESTLNNAELFNRDLFVLSFSFLIGCLISLLFAYDNNDVRGWWVLIIYFITIYGLVFSLVFSSLALLIKNHKKYMMIFSFLIFVLVSLGIFFPHKIMLPSIGSIDTFFVITSSLLIIHCLVVIGYKVVR